MPKIEMGKKYKTRDGHDVTILAVDQNFGLYSVAAIVKGYHNSAHDDVFRFKTDGHFLAGANHPLDLIEVKPKVKSWVNVYKETVGTRAEADRRAQVWIDRGYKRLACVEVTVTEGEGLEPEEPCK